MITLESMYFAGVNWEWGKVWLAGLGKVGERSWDVCNEVLRNVTSV